jgi:hypothetical protein
MHNDEARILRERLAELCAALDRIPDALACLPTSLLVQTTTVATYPTVAGRYYACTPVRAGGTEDENQVPSFTTLAGTYYAANLGSAIPPVGTRTVIDLVGDRYVFQYNG